MALERRPGARSSHTAIARRLPGFWARRPLRGGRALAQRALPGLRAALAARRGLRGAARDIAALAPRAASSRPRFAPSTASA